MHVFCRPGHTRWQAAAQPSRHVYNRLVASAIGPHGVVVFDGTCAFCERWVTFIATRDRDGYFRFGASQTASAQALMAQFDETRASTGSIILIEEGAVYRKSTAVLRIARRLPLPWTLASVFLVVPRPLRDAVYAAVAAVRHRIGGHSNA
jgi:predicted DCC family thiol-disulfide oxidoreductase YuxK